MLPINLLKSPTKSRSPIISSIVTSNLHCAWHWNQTQSSAPQVFLFFFFTDLIYNKVKIHIINKLLNKYSSLYIYIYIYLYIYIYIYIYIHTHTHIQAVLDFDLIRKASSERQGVQTHLYTQQPGGTWATWDFK